MERYSFIIVICDRAPRKEPNDTDQITKKMLLKPLTKEFLKIFFHLEFLIFFLGLNLRH